MHKFLCNNCMILLNILDKASEGVFGIVRFEKLVFLGLREMDIPTDYIFHKDKMGPYTREMKIDIRYLDEIGFIEEESHPTKEKFDLLVYRITEDGRDFLRRYNIHKELSSRFQMLMATYGYMKEDELLEFVHTNYKDPFYGPEIHKRLRVIKIDSKLAGMFWEKITERHQEGAPFWYLSSLLEHIASSSNAGKMRASMDMILELHSLLIDYSKKCTLALTRGQPLPVDRPLQNLIYDKCYVVQDQAIEQGILKMEELEVA